jgi:hypothetical protein
LVRAWASTRAAAGSGRPAAASISLRVAEGQFAVLQRGQRRREATHELLGGVNARGGRPRRHAQGAGDLLVHPVLVGLAGSGGVRGDGCEQLLLLGVEVGAHAFQQRERVELFVERDLAQVPVEVVEVQRHVHGELARPEHCHFAHTYEYTTSDTHRKALPHRHFRHS